MKNKAVVIGVVASLLTGGVGYLVGQRVLFKLPGIVDKCIATSSDVAAGWSANFYKQLSDKKINQVCNISLKFNEDAKKANPSAVDGQYCVTGIWEKQKEEGKKK